MLRGYKSLVRITIKMITKKMEKRSMKKAITGKTPMRNWTKAKNSLAMMKKSIAMSAD